MHINLLFFQKFRGERKMVFPRPYRLSWPKKRIIREVDLNNINFLKTSNIRTNSFQMLLGSAAPIKHQHMYKATVRPYVGVLIRFWFFLFAEQPK
jgi:hypothetical protein